MPVRLLAVVAALLALGLGAGCADRAAPLVAETEEPLFAQGVQMKRQGRSGEALASFLRVIDKRGGSNAAESHLEAGLIYLHATKDPVLAYYHFRRYLELQPNSREAPRVRGMVDAAAREFASRMPGRPMTEQSVRLAADEETAKLRREIEELRAELATLRGGGAQPVVRSVRPGLTARPPQPVPMLELPATESAPAEEPAAIAAAPAPAAVRPAQVNPAPAPRPAAKAPASRGGRAHAVAPKETLYSISKRYGVSLEALVEANRAALPQGARSPLKIGMELRVP
jgi:hypothetical protein